MKKINLYIRLLLLFAISIFAVSCVHDDKYDTPDASKTQCRDLTANTTIEKVKKAYTLNQTIDANDVLVGYVSSSDETGNIYKTIYIQDAPENPTQGLTISVDANSTYANYPQGSKIYISMKGLAMGTYGGLIQIGAMQPDGTFGRIPDNKIATNIAKSCDAPVTIVPKLMKLSDMKSANDQYIGALIKVENVEFDSKNLCTTFAPNGETVEKTIGEGWDAAGKKYTTTRILRNSGFASFANQTLPAGNGTFVGILSKYNSTYQLYINRSTDLKMDKFPRLDGIAANPCSVNITSLPAKTVADVKKLLSGTTSQISEDAILRGIVTANDETGNLYKYIYVEDATGGIRININKLDLYLDPRFKVGKELVIRLKDLYISNVNGEIQLGGLYKGNFGQIEENVVYYHFIDSNKPVVPVTATERTISQLSAADVGRWVKIKNVQFAASELGRAYALSNATTNRTIEDCSGNTIILRTSNFATFATNEIDGGKGDIYAILSIYNGTYQLWIPNLANADLDGPRCDGATPEKTIFAEGFDVDLTNSSSKWMVKNVTGSGAAWVTANYGNPRPCALINGSLSGGQNNEDWLISKPIALTGLAKASLSFINDIRYTGGTLNVMITDNFTGDVNSTVWTTLKPFLDTNTGSNNWVYSDKLDISAFAGKTVTVAFKYTSTGSSASTWEIDNVIIKGR